MKNFTFKTVKPTGPYRSFDNDYHQIKLDKVIVGSIDDVAPYRIRLQVTRTEEELKAKPSNPCPWRWVVLKKESASVQEAKEFLKSHAESIQKQYQIHISKD